MYLARIEVTNFRIFGGEFGRDNSVEKPGLVLDFQPGLNVLVGENDSGKTAVIDAIRTLLGMTTDEWYALSRDDFHVSDSAHAKDMWIVGEFRELSDEEGAALLEWLCLTDVGGRKCPVLRLTLHAERKELRDSTSRWDREIEVEVRAGAAFETGKRMEGRARELLRATYLRPLRDADRELSSGRGSRLSQILGAHPDFKKGSRSELHALEEIVKKADAEVRVQPPVIDAAKDINEGYLSQMSLRRSPLEADIRMSKVDLRHILERMELLLRPPKGLQGLGDQRIDLVRGMGYSNLLFMAAELLLLGKRVTPAMPLVLIEEPEAHLHPQLQIRLMEFLGRQCCPEKQSSREKSNPRLQAIITSHSPNLASAVDVENLILFDRGHAFPLRRGETKLAQGDYAHLGRFLDVTKANFFFATAVMLVEGLSEQILISALARMLERPFSESGVSVVAVGHKGLFRYSRIFQRRYDEHPDIRVACVMDLDIPSDWRDSPTSAKQPRRTTEEAVVEAKRNGLREIYNSGPVRAFPSTRWTLEHDLGLAGLAEEVHLAVRLAELSDDKRMRISDVKRVIGEAESEFRGWAVACDKDRIACLVFEQLLGSMKSKKTSKVVVAECLAQVLSHEVKRKPLSAEKLRQMLPGYIVEAIDYVTRIDEEGAATGGVAT
jgi:putative ATP-dependent endonuclease of OLD family